MKPKEYRYDRLYKYPRKSLWYMTSQQRNHTQTKIVAFVGRVLDKNGKHVIAISFLCQRFEYLVEPCLAYPRGLKYDPKALAKARACAKNYCRKK